MAYRQADPRYTALAKNPDQALIAAFLGAFGVSINDLSDMLSIMSKKPSNYQILGLQMLVAAVQVRVNTSVVLVSEMRDFPILTIGSDRKGINDTINFKAFHVAGHMMIAVASTHPVALKAKKKGNCVTGEYLTDSVSGKINKEIYDNLSKEEFREFSARYEKEPELKKFILTLFDTIRDN